MFQGFGTVLGSRGLQVVGPRLEVSSVTVTTSWHGMVLWSLQSGSTVQWNTATSNVNGIYIGGSTNGGLAAHNQIVGMVADCNDRNAFVLDAATGWKLKFNDVYMTNASNCAYRRGVLLQNTASGATITNNTFYIDSLGNGAGYRYGIWYNAVADQTGTSSNYNNILGANYTGRWNGNAYDTLAN